MACQLATFKVEKVQDIIEKIFQKMETKTQ